MRALEAAVKKGDWAEGVNAVPWDKFDDLKIELNDELKSVLDKSGAVAAKSMPKSMDISFDETNPEAVAWARNRAAELVERNIIPDSKDAIRAIITRSFEEGITPASSARLIREHIGILPRHADAVETYRQMLIDAGRTEDDAAGLAARYAQKLVNYRANNIARTETINASSAGQDALWNQAVQDDLLDPEEWERVWIADETERTCELCQDLDGTTADLGEPFEGGIMRPTAHPSCRCTLGLQKKRGAHNAGPLEQLARRSPSERFAQSDTRTVLIYDHGDNVHLAERIARDVGRVLYYCPWQSELQYKDLVVGTGLPGVEKVETFWDHIEEADLIYCPDVHDYDVVETLREQGRKVVGAGSGARLELDREFVRELSASAGLPTINSVKIEGLGALIEYLKDVEDKWVKTNVYRGTMETFHHVNFESSKPILDELAVTLGPGAETIEFYVEDPVAGVEVGFETFIQGGKLLSPMLYGCTDGQCSLFRVLAYSELPAQFRDIFDKILPQIAAYNIRADFHTEIRFDGTNAYLTDVTMRPPGAYVSGLMSEAMTNFTDVLFGLADGAAPDPVFAAKMAGSVQLVSDHALKRWFAIDAPADADAWLKLTAYSKFEGRRYVSPGNNAIGGIVATGETLEEIVKTIEERYATLKSAGIDPIAGIDAFEALKV